MTKEQEKALAPLIARRKKLEKLPATHDIIISIKMLDGIINVFKTE